MRTDTLFGLAGVAALMSLCSLSPSLCLSQTPLLPATPGPVRSEDLPPAPPTMADLRQLQEQYQSTHATIETLRQELQSEIERRATSVTSEVTLLRQDFATQHELDLQAMHRSNHTTLTIVLVMIGILALGVMFIALVPLRMMNRLAARVATSPTGLTLAAENAYEAAFTPLEQSSTRLKSAVQLLEQRLVELETRTIHPPATPAATPEPQTRATDPRPAHKAPSTPRVSLAMGGGEALMFLPQDVRPPKGRPHMTLLQRIKQVFKPSPTVKPGPAKAG